MNNFNIFILFLIVIVAFVFIGLEIKSIIRIKKGGFIEGEITNFSFGITNDQIYSEEGKNVTLSIEIKRAGMGKEILLIRSVSLKKPPVGQKVKILFNKDDPNKSEIITGTEVIISFVKIISLFCFMFLLIVYILKK
jgi:hypothetical protein